MKLEGMAGNVLTAVVTAAVLGVLGIAMGVFEKGTQAINKEQIRAVVQEEFKTDAGKTYGARISEIDGTLISLETRTGILQSDLNDVERSLLDLASE